MQNVKKQPNNPMQPHRRRSADCRVQSTALEEGDRRTAGGGPQPEILATAPRCGAQTRAGAPCRSPAVGGAARCRMHGGQGSGAPRGNRNAWKHGARSAEYAEIVRELRAIERGGPAF